MAHPVAAPVKPNGNYGKWSETQRKPPTICLRIEIFAILSYPMMSQPFRLQHLGIFFARVEINYLDFFGGTKQYSLRSIQKRLVQDFIEFFWPYFLTNHHFWEIWSYHSKDLLNL